MASLEKGAEIIPDTPALGPFYASFLQCSAAPQEWSKKQPKPLME
jgi:hypothetical protein